MRQRMIRRWGGLPLALALALGVGGCGLPGSAPEPNCENYCLKAKECNNGVEVATCPATCQKLQTHTLPGLFTSIVRCSLAGSCTSATDLDQICMEKALAEAPANGADPLAVGLCEKYVPCLNDPAKMTQAQCEATYKQELATSVWRLFRVSSLACVTDCYKTQDCAVVLDATNNSKPLWDCVNTCGLPVAP